MRSKLFGSAVGFIAAGIAIGVLCIGLVFAQTSTSTPSGDNSSTEAATLRPMENAENVTTAPSNERGVGKLQTDEQEAAEEKPKLLARSSIAKELAREFKQSKDAVIGHIDTGFSDSKSVSTETSSQISDVKVYFHVYNPLQERALLTISTGIRKGLLTYIRLEGATGYKWENDELVIAYVPLPAAGSGLVVLTATPLISGEPLKLEVNPVLKNEGIKVVESGKAETAYIRAKSQNVLKSFGISRSSDPAEDEGLTQEHEAAAEGNVSTTTEISSVLPDADSSEGSATSSVSTSLDSASSTDVSAIQ